MSIPRVPEQVGSAAEALPLLNRDAPLIRAIAAKTITSLRFFASSAHQVVSDAPLTLNRCG
ncbi:MAG: hypothetical protein J4N94_07080, partial [Chloroflexi bacterium]|nr:hypothetical protein [Chloroflexota bacterium]